MVNDWQPIQNTLKTIYQDFELPIHFESDAAYLKQAFEKTEALWNQQFDRMDDVVMVMLSEAPLFGKKQTYIYNPDAGPTAFFHFNDLGTLGGGYPDEAAKLASLEKKQIMLKRLAVKGLLVLDLFPFAFNPTDTAINYQKMSSSMYNRLLSDSFSVFLEHKLNLIMKKVQRRPTFIYRYKKLYKKTNRIVEQLLQKLNMIPKGTNLDSISGTNMSLDREKLAKLYRNAQGGLLY